MDKCICVWGANVGMPTVQYHSIANSDLHLHNIATLLFLADIIHTSTFTF